MAFMFCKHLYKPQFFLLFRHLACLVEEILFSQEGLGAIE